MGMLKERFLMTRTAFFSSIFGVAAIPQVAEGNVRPIAERDGRKLLAIEYPIETYLSGESIQKLKQALVPYEEEFNCKFMVLSGGARVVDPLVPPVVVTADFEPLLEELRAINKSLQPKVITIGSSA
jgi:hypothetical protein